MNENLEEITFKIDDICQADMMSECLAFSSVAKNEKERAELTYIASINYWMRRQWGYKQALRRMGYAENYTNSFGKDKLVILSEMKNYYGRMKKKTPYDKLIPSFFLVN